VTNPPIGNAASFVAMSTHNTRSSAVAPLTAKEQFHQKIDTWRDASPLGPGEQRDVAATRIKEAYDRSARELDLSQCGLSTLPDFEGLTNLKVLNLGMNQLGTLPEKAFEGLENLESLYFFNNGLSALSDKAFEGLTNLKILNLCKNQLSTLPEKAFEGLANLQRLYLYNNQLSVLSDNAFEGLAKLQGLYLYNNQFSALSYNAFEGLAKLEGLYLYNNPLSMLPDNVFEGLKNLQELYLHKNLFIFKPSIDVPSRCVVRFEQNLKTVEEEFQAGNHHLLDFSLNGIDIPGTVSERGLVKMQIMLDHANHRVTKKEWAWENSAVINQLVHQASILAESGSAQDRVVKTQAQTLLARYLATEHVNTFAKQAENIFPPSEHEGLLLMTPDGQRGVSIAKHCYESNILNAPFANRDHENAAFTNGVVSSSNQQRVRFSPFAGCFASIPIVNRSISACAE